MTDETRIAAADVRVTAAMGAIVDGVAYDQVGDETTPRMLRLSILATRSEVAALVSLLTAANVFSAADYREAVATALEAEVGALEVVIGESLGQPVELG